MKKLTLPLLLSALTGCVTINEELIRTPEPTLATRHKPTIETKTGQLIQTLNGHGDNAGVLSGTTVLDALAKGMMARWEDRELISDYGKPGKLDQAPDYTITLSGKRDEDSSIAGAILSGLSLMILPTSATLTYDIDVEMTNHKTKKTYITHVKNAVTTWMNILLFPALPLSWLGSHHAINDMADYTYNDFKAQGAFD